MFLLHYLSDIEQIAHEFCGELEPDKESSEHNLYIRMDPLTPPPPEDGAPSLTLPQAIAQWLPDNRAIVVSFK